MWMNVKNYDNFVIMCYVSRLISVALNNKLYIGVCSYQTLIIIVLKRTNIFEIFNKGSRDDQGTFHQDKTL